MTSWSRSSPRAATSTARSRSRSSWATTTPPRSPELEALRERAASCGVLLDFDGTLAEIVARPELARPVDGVRETLSALAERFRVVGIVTGRRSEEVAAVLDVPHLRLFGLYGLEEDPAMPEFVAAASPLARRAADEVPGAWVEDKGVSLAVHYRAAPDPVAARATLVVALTPVASDSGLELIEGKMVLELVPPNRPLKGGAIDRVVGELALEGALYAGDDHADLDAFVALDRLASRGGTAVKVAVRGDETPLALVDASDLAVDGPGGLVALLDEIR